MSEENEVKFSLTLMMNKEKTKVLFAVVDSSFADVLLSFMTLPLGQILLLLQNHYGDKAPRIGSLNTLYSGLQNLDDDCFWTKEGKLMLLNPISSLDYEECVKLKLNLCRPQPTKYYRCACRYIVALHHGVICQNCRKLMSTAIQVDSRAAANGRCEAFTKQTISFVISDDMKMLPNVTIGSLLRNLESLGVTDAIHEDQKITAVVGFNEIMDLLKGLLFSRTLLTDLFAKNGQAVHYSSTVKAELLSLGDPELKEKEQNCNSKKIKINAIVRKSSREFLFAQVERDFVDFLFSLLTIPLGQVEHLLNANSGLRSFDNLYRSFADFNGDRCLVTQNTKDSLLKPKLPYQYLCDNTLFSLGEQSKPKLYRTWDCYGTYEWSHLYVYDCVEVPFADPKQMGCYVKWNGIFMVADNLTVKPLFMDQSLTTLLGLEVPLTDIEELEINIGLEEALNMLKASLTSTRAMTEGLKLNTSPKKRPKQEQ